MQVEWLTNGDVWANSYVVGNILVDAGVMPMAVAPYKEQIETIVLTHCQFHHAREASIPHKGHATEGSVYSTSQALVYKNYGVASTAPPHFQSTSFF